MMARETCQACGHQVHVTAPSGRACQHRIDGSCDDMGICRPGLPRCGRSGHPTQEELARRKGRRLERMRARLSEAREDAHAALDAYLEGRPEYQDRLDGFRELALLALNEASHPVKRFKRPWSQDGIPPHDPPILRCVFCGSLVRLEPEVMVPHHTLCSLLYLAGRLDEKP